MADHAISVNTAYSAISPAPQANDTISLSDGAILTIDTDTVSLGVDGEGNWSITGAGNAGGTVVVNTGCTLSVKSGIHCSSGYNSSITGTISGSGTGRILYTGTYANIITGCLIYYDNMSLVSISGTSTSLPFVIENTGGGLLTVGVPYYTQYTNLQYVSVVGNVTVNSRRGVRLIDCVFDENTATLAIISVSSTDNFEISGLRHYGDVVWVENVADPDTTETRIAENIRIAGQLTWDNCGSLVWTDMVAGSTTGGSGPKGSLESCVFDAELWASRNIEYAKDCYIGNSDLTNPHGLGGIGLVDGCIFRVFGPVDSGSDTGDAVLAPTADGGESLTPLVVRNCILLEPDTGGLGSIFTTFFGHATLKAYVYNNTIVRSASTIGLRAANVGETDSIPAGMIEVWANNIVVGQSQIGFQAAGTIADDAIVVANCNCTTDPVDQYEVSSYAAKYVSAPGSNDVNVDPEFIAVDRDIETWAVSIGCSSGESAANKRAYAFNALISGDYISSDLVGYIREGITPTNVDLIGSGLNTTIDGYVIPSYIGAVEPVEATPIQADGFASNSTWGSASIIDVIVDGFVSDSEWGSSDIAIEANGFSSISYFGSPYLSEVASGIVSNSTWSDFDIMYEASGFQSSSEWGDVHGSQVYDGFVSNSSWGDMDLSVGMDGFSSDSTWGDVELSINADGFVSVSEWGNVYYSEEANGFYLDSLWGDAEVAYSDSIGFNSNSTWDDSFVCIDASGFLLSSQWGDVFVQIEASGFVSDSEWNDIDLVDDSYMVDGFQSVSEWNDAAYAIIIDGFVSDSEWNDSSLASVTDGFTSYSEWIDIDIPISATGFSSSSEWIALSIAIEVDGFVSLSTWGDVRNVEILSSFNSGSDWGDLQIFNLVDSFYLSSVWGDVALSAPISRMGYNVIDIGVNVSTYASIIAYVGRV